MTTDLEQLVRETLGDRAASVTSGPRWVRPDRPARRRWVAPVAAAAAVVLLAGGAATWRAERSSGPDLAAAATCRVALPTTWQQALTGPAIAVAGRAVQIRAMTPAGDAIVEWRDAGEVDHVALADGSSRVTELYQVSRAFQFDEYQVDDRHLVLSVSPRVEQPNVTASPVTDIVVIALTSHPRSTHLRAKFGAPKGWIVQGDGGVAKIYKGVVYWVQDAPTGQSEASVVASYTVATGTYRVVRRYTQAAFVAVDSRGVYWPGGGVFDPDLPGVVPTLTESYPATGDHTNLVSDGNAFAWQDLNHRAPLIRWADQSGATRAFVMSSSVKGASPLISAVSGHLVFVTFGAVPSPPTYVLDTRTGALAQVSTSDLGGIAAGNRIGFNRSTNGHDAGAFTVAAPDLPPLRCA